jgi:hypothetical protein
VDHVGPFQACGYRHRQDRVGFNIRFTSGSSHGIQPAQAALMTQSSAQK